MKMRLMILKHSELSLKNLCVPLRSPLRNFALKKLLFGAVSQRNGISTSRSETRAKVLASTFIH